MRWHFVYKNKKARLEAFSQHVNNNRAIKALMKKHKHTKKAVMLNLGISLYRLNKILAEKELAFKEDLYIVQMMATDNLPRPAAATPITNKEIC